MSVFDDRSGLVLVLIIVAVVATILLAAVLFMKLLTKFRPVHDQLTPLGAKMAFWGAVAYTVLPIDLLPDPIYLDDIGALLAALAYINSLLDGQSDSTGQPLPGRPDELGQVFGDHSGDLSGDHGGDHGGDHRGDDNDEGPTDIIGW